MLGADAVRAVSQGTLGVLLIVGHRGVVAIACLAAVAGGASAVFSPASTGLIPSLVDADALQQANALQQTASSAAGIAGPAIAGVLVATVGPGWALVGDATSFAFSAIMLAQLRLERVPRPTRQRMITDLRDGWGDFWSRPWFRDIVIGASMFNLLYAAYNVLGPVSSDRYYHGATAWATVATSAAVGSVAAGLISVRLRPRRPLRAAVPPIALSSLAPFAFAAKLPIEVIAAAAAAGGGGLIVFESLWQTSVQRHIPKDRISRASSYDYFGSLVAYPAGLAVTGPISAAIGVRPLLWAVGAMLILLVAVMFTPSSVRGLADQVTAGSLTDTDLTSEPGEPGPLAIP
jgi:predicted MFS family arabinose efflux permease